MKDPECLIYNQDIIFRKEEEDAFLFNPEDGKLICVNSVGVFIWNYCNGKNNRAKIVDLILKEYPDTPKSKIIDDYDDFVDQLRKINFLKVKR